MVKPSQVVEWLIGKVVKCCSARGSSARSARGRRDATSREKKLFI